MVSESGSAMGRDNRIHGGTDPLATMIGLGVGIDYMLFIVTNR